MFVSLSLFFFPQDMSEGNGCGNLLVKARFAFQQTNEDELSFSKGDIIIVTRQEDGGWWEGSLKGKSGWFPSNYVRELKGSGMRTHSSLHFTIHCISVRNIFGQKPRTLISWPKARCVLSRAETMNRLIRIIRLLRNFDRNCLCRSFV